MPALNEAWRAVCRFIARTDQPDRRDRRDRRDRAVAADPETERSDSVRQRNDTAEHARAGNSRLHGFYDRVREQVLENQRSSELAMREEMRNDRRAKRRALILLMTLLNPEQRQEFRKFRQFHVIGGSSGNRYRIRVAAFANIDVLCANGRVKHRLCAHPAGDVPIYDVMAAQLLHLQDPAAEQRFLQRANVHPALSEDRLHSRSAWIV
jgi:hypothetical protein